MRIATALAASCLVAACGARTGLLLDDAPPADVPDVGVRDAPDVMDVPDAPRPECVTDRDCDDGVDCTRDRCERGRCARRLDDLACDDGRYCNGVERCGPRGCAAGPPPVCDDGVSCTRDACDEARRGCAATADSALCPVSHRCDARRGCVARALANAGFELYEVELPSGALRRIGGVRSFTDLALHPDRALYGVTAQGGLWRVNDETGFASIVADTGRDATALDVAPDGTLYMAGDDGFFRVDPASGRAARAASFPPGLVASGDIAFLRGRALATAHPRGDDDQDDLVAFDLDAGTSARVGPTGFACVWALAAFGDTLYGMTCEGRVLSLDPGTGRAREIVRHPLNFYGATAR